MLSCKKSKEGNLRKYYQFYQIWLVTFNIFFLRISFWIFSLLNVLGILIFLFSSSKMFPHSAINIVKRNKSMSTWLINKSNKGQHDLLNSKEGIRYIAEEYKTVSTQRLLFKVTEKEVKSAIRKHSISLNTTTLESMLDISWFWCLVVQVQHQESAEISCVSNHQNFFFQNYINLVDLIINIKCSLGDIIQGWLLLLLPDSEPSHKCRWLQFEQPTLEPKGDHELGTHRKEEISIDCEEKQESEGYTFELF